MPPARRGQQAPKTPCAARLLGVQAQGRILLAIRGLACGGAVVHLADLVVLLWVIYLREGECAA